jgi:N-methylhydantoinase B
MAGDLARSTLANRNLDDISVAVFQRRLEAITDGMAKTLIRTTRSPLFNQVGDFAAGLMSASGTGIAQASYIGLMALALYPGCKYVIDFFGDDIHPGDVIIHNDVWYGNLQHADTGFYKPVFVDDQLVGWSACRGHWADIGGAVKGTANPEATEVFQEALRLPPVKVIDRGVLRRDVWNMIFSNVRMRDKVEADARAQIGACTVGERRLEELVRREGIPMFEQLTEALLDSTERMLRNEIRQIPDGEYTGGATVNMDGSEISDGTGEHGFKIKLTVRKSDDKIEFDYTGTDPQTPGFVNAAYTSAAGATIVSLLLCLESDVPHNGALSRAVKITIPEGTLLNAKYPAATFFGNKLCEHNGEAVMQALSKAIPKQVCAAWGRRLSWRISGVDPRTGGSFHDIYFLCREGAGGVYGVDGFDQDRLLGAAGGGGEIGSAQDYELFELQNPVYLWKNEYWTDSAGPGQWRGGLGTETIVEYYAEENLAVIHGDGIEVGPWGLFGGHTGPRNRIQVRYPDGTSHETASKEIVGGIPAGTVSHHFNAGGGGFGPPALRPVERVLEDVRNGVVSIESAERDYKVAIDAAGTGVDMPRTNQLRDAAPATVGDIPGYLAT